jgi:hypothetical protein
MPKSNTWILLLAAAASGLSLVCAGASLAISLIAAAAPPVSQYLSAAQNAEVAARMRSGWWLPVCLVAMALTCAVQIILRRPVLTTARWRASPDTGLTSVLVMAVLFVMLSFMIVRSMSSTFELMRMAAPAPITDSLSFSSLGGNLGTLSLIASCMANVTFCFWWKSSRSPATVVGWMDSAAHVNGG